MLLKTTLAASLIALVAFTGLAHAQMTPTGLWKTIDDDSKKEKSLVRITESNGVFSGRIEKLLDPATDPKAVCDKCSDDRKDKPILGLEILRAIKQSESDKAVYEGGSIVDPNNGKSYRARLKPVNGGAQLEMRGYLGPFFRTQVWHRVE
jgi:uncharacterized protein (DUF2147 family)